MNKHSKLITSLKDYVFIVLGLLIYAFGYSAFILPAKIVTGGVTGLASLFYYSPLHWNVAVVYYTINIILLAIAYRTVGRQFVLRTIFGATTCALMLGVLKPLFPEPIVDGPFVNTILGAVLSGVGIGMVYVHNGSSAGTDIVAAMATKKRNVSFGRMMMYCDLVIIGLSYFVFRNDGNVAEKIVYGVIFLVLFAQVSDMFINSNRQAVQFFIFSKHWQEIADVITSNTHRGCTVLDGIGWYTKNDVKVLMVVCRRLESVNIFRIVKSIDPEAFITQAAVRGAYGQGFDEMKFKPLKQEELHLEEHADNND